MFYRRTALAVATVAVGAGVLTGCQSDEGSGDSSMPAAPTSTQKGSAQGAAAKGAPTYATVKSAQHPAMCEMPAGQLRNGKATHGRGHVLLLGPESGQGGIAPLQGDLDDDGRPDLLVAFSCDQGAVTWPEVVVAYGAGNKVLGSYDLRNETANPEKQQHANVTYWNYTPARGDMVPGVQLGWTTYQGAGADEHHYKGTFSLVNGRLVLAGVEDTTPEKQSADSPENPPAGPTGGAPRSKGGSTPTSEKSEPTESPTTPTDEESSQTADSPENPPELPPDGDQPPADPEPQPEAPAPEENPDVPQGESVPGGS